MRNQASKTKPRFPSAKSVLYTLEFPEWGFEGGELGKEKLLRERAKPSEYKRGQLFPKVTFKRM